MREGLECVKGFCEQRIKEIEYRGGGPITDAGDYRLPKVTVFNEILRYVNKQLEKLDNG